MEEYKLELESKLDNWLDENPVNNAQLVVKNNYTLDSV